MLAGGIAHDFKNLLTGIVGYASLAALDVAEGSRAADHLEKVELTAARATELCQQLLVYAGRARRVPVGVDLHVAIRETLDLVLHSLAPGVEVALRLSDAPLVVHADPAQLRQVVMNLIINASDATPVGGGEVTVHARAARLDPALRAVFNRSSDLADVPYALVEVHDRGAGIPPALRSRIFEPFFTTKGVGRGLGLSAVLGIVRSHGGAIAMESTAGLGTTFRVLLPIAETAAEQSRAGPEPWRAIGRVLVVEPDDAVRGLARSLLRTRGFSIDEANDIDEALGLIRESARAYRLVILDRSVLPDDDLVDRIGEACPSCRLLLLGGLGERPVRVADGVGVLDKPFSYDGLSRAVHDLLGLATEE